MNKAGEGALSRLSRAKLRVFNAQYNPKRPFAATSASIPTTETTEQFHCEGKREGQLSKREKVKGSS